MTILLPVQMDRGGMRTYLHKKFVPGIQHLYMRSDDWGVIFYDDIDRLVYYTEECAAKRRCGVTVLAASYMFNHIHNSIRVRSASMLSDFAWGAMSPFARAFNYRRKRSGEVFHREFGWSSKTNSKKIRNNICYVVNNHVEKKLCSRAMESRWDFLAYATSEHPFSKEIVNPSPDLKHAMRFIRKKSSKNQPLKYPFLLGARAKLNEEEWEQLIDYIIVTYKLVDFEESVKYFKGLDEMITAPDITTGSEFDVGEDFSNEPDTPYLELFDYWSSHFQDKSVYELSLDNRIQVANEMYFQTSASKNQIRKFLHIPAPQK